jgi:hypothetical protein
MKDRTFWLLLSGALLLGFAYAGLCWLLLVAPYAAR